MTGITPETELREEVPRYSFRVEFAELNPPEEHDDTRTGDKVLVRTLGRAVLSGKVIATVAYGHVPSQAERDRASNEIMSKMRMLGLLPADVDVAGP